MEEKGGKGNPPFSHSFSVSLSPSLSLSLSLSLSRPLVPPKIRFERPPPVYPRVERASGGAPAAGGYAGLLRGLHEQRDGEETGASRSRSRSKS